MTRLLFFISFLWTMCLYSQTVNPITLEDILTKGTFRSKSIQNIQWGSKGNYYFALVPNRLTQKSDIIKYDLVSGTASDTILSGSRINCENDKGFSIDQFKFDSQENQILLATETEAIYRYSSKSVYYVYNLTQKTCFELANRQKIGDVTFSPDGQKVAYTRDNNLYYVDKNKQIEIAVTEDGLKNKIINGHGDWVYEEEYELSQAFHWSKDSQKILFCAFDESEVRNYELQTWNDSLYPQLYTYKYPKAGEKNSKLEVKLYDLKVKKTLKIPLEQYQEGYIPRVGWTANTEVLYIVQQNRSQNEKKIWHYNQLKNTLELIFEENDSAYIEINNDLYYLDDKVSFIFTSEMGGYRHIYKYNFITKILSQITKGNWEVDKLIGINENKNQIFFTSTEHGAEERQLYSVKINGENKTQILSYEGVNDPQLSPNYKYVINKNSTINKPSSYAVYNINGKVIRDIEDNQLLRKKLSEYKMAKVEFFTIDSISSQSLHAWIIKPTDFNKNKKYPVLLYVYGGPGHQTVLNNWMGANYFWFQMLAQKGYIIVSVDGRGTGGNGAHFKKITTGQLGKLECEDVIATAKYLGSLSYIDKSRIGIFGWSFGGYLSSLAITLGADYFKLAVAVAPVTNWRYYDTIYTERFLKTPQENPKGYDDNSPVNLVDKMKGHYLLIHGTGDDNVHFQNAIAMQNALIKANKKFKCMFYPDRNHGIYGGNTRLHLYQLMTDFIVENL